MTAGSQYLLAVYVLDRRGESPVSSGAVADLLDRSQAAVSEGFARLDENDLVDHEPYEGVVLTDDGEARARSLHERYVTLSWFFRSVLDLDDYEREAMELAGALSPMVADRLVETLPYDDDR